MAFVQRANVVLEVKDDAVERMLDMGYDVIDGKGNIIKTRNPKTAADFKKIVDSQVKKITELEAKITELEAEIVKLKTKKTTRKPAEKK